MQPRWTNLLALIALPWSTFAIAQNTLGELLDAGAKPLSAEQFRKEVVQRTIYGPVPTGLALEIMYSSGGSVEGVGSGGGTGFASEWTVQVRGTWKFGENGTICTGMVFDGPTIRANFPSRCQFWFKLDERYFLSNSDSDRRGRVLMRTLRK